ncbi:MAG TPA: hypothetical protein VMR21_10040 [Vicinamibacteria bacterium]|nr:hypothetical protein [Vicinamibacteria bacterium]
MRTSRVLTLAALLLAAGGIAQAKFGITKTRVTLKRVRPPEVALVGDAVTVRVTSRARGVSDRQLDLVRDRVEAALEADGDLRVVQGGAESAVVVSLDHLEARISDTVIYEQRRVKTGEREEWDEKKKKYVKKDVYEDRREPVRLRTVRGRVEARVEVEGPAGEQSADASASYEHEFKGDVSVPEEASSEEVLERYLIDEAGRRAAAAVSFSPDPVEALLAVDGELKDGNRLAESGLWTEALAAWSARTFKGSKEAARLHNLGVAHEALAYALPVAAEAHRAKLEEAADFYRRAVTLDPKEKYFAEPVQRLETSRDYAVTAGRNAAEAQRWQDAQGQRDPRGRRRAEQADRGNGPEARRRPAPRRDEPVGGKTPAQAPDALGSSAGLRSPLRNGSFESGLESWTVAGKGSVVPDGDRGRVFQAAAGAAGTTIAQTVDLDMQAVPARLSLAYRVTSGEGRIRALVVYDDVGGRSRTSSLEITTGDAPGEWTSWTGDLVALRPRPARLREVRIAVEGGTVLVDGVSIRLD